MSSNVLKALALGGIVAIPHFAAAEVPEQWLETARSLAFGAPPTIGDPALSPDGTRLIFVQQSPEGVSMLRSLNLAEGGVATVLEGTEEGHDILWCDFASEPRVVCDLQARGLPEGRADYQRLVGVNADGTNLQVLAEGRGCDRYDELTGAPRIDWLPDDPERIMILCGGTAGLLDVYTGELTEAGGAGDVGEGACEIRSDGEGTSTIVCDQANGDSGQQLYSNGHSLANLYRGRADGREQWFVRDDTADSWEPFLETDPLDFENPFRPVGYGTALDRVFNIAWDPETAAWSLYRRDLAGGENQLVFAHGAANVELVDTMGPHGRVVAAAFLDGRSQRAIVDRRVAEVFQYLSELLPDLEVEIVDESWDQNIYLARVRGPNSIGEFLLVDMESETVQSLGPEYDHLAGFALSETQLIEIDSSSGGPIRAHLTVPFEAEWPIPAVVIPRSAPGHDNVGDPDYLAQFLAASGYVVLRVENRIEEEHGSAWLPERAVIGWNRSVSDVNDAVGYLVEAGFTQPGTICGAGKDYGAYVALMSAIEYPDLLSCVVGIAGVTDPAATPGAILAREAGGDGALESASPIRRADEIEAPVLLFHGGSDTKVSLADHAEAFSDALGDAGGNLVFIEYPNATHAIERGPYRIDMLARMRGFLAEHIGPALTEEDEPIEQALRWRPQ